jgi:hypothetical protein
MQRRHQQIVILSQVLVDDVNTGFQGFQNLQVPRARSGSGERGAGGGGVQGMSRAAAPPGQPGQHDGRPHWAAGRGEGRPRGQGPSTNSGLPRAAPPHVPGLQVLRVNGEEVLNLRHLRRLLASCASPYMRLDLEDDRIIVLDRAAAEESTPRIQARYRVPFLESADLAGPGAGADDGEEEAEGEAGAWGPSLAAAAAGAGEGAASGSAASGGGAREGASGVQGLGVDTTDDGLEEAEEGEADEGMEEAEGEAERRPLVPSEPTLVVASAGSGPPRKRRKGGEGGSGGLNPRSSSIEEVPPE